MGIFQSVLDNLDYLFSGAWAKKAHADYYDPANCYRFQKPEIVVYIPLSEKKRLLAAYKGVREVLQECGVVSIITHDPTLANSAEVRFLIDATVKSGGVTHTDHDPTDHKILRWAAIHIAISEKGRSFDKTACHETTHLYCSGHSGDRRDANHSPCYVAVLSKADKETLRRCYRKD